MLWKLVNANTISRVFFIWLTLVAVSGMWFSSILSVFILRHYWLPEPHVQLPLDFIHKSVNHRGNEATRQLVAMMDLSQNNRLPNEDYAFNLELTLPRNEENLKLGTFSVRGALNVRGWSSSRSPCEAKHQTVDPGLSFPWVVERMVLIPFNSPLIEWMRRILWSPLYVLNFKKEESRLIVPLWDTVYKPRVTKPHLLITIPSELWISSAILHMDVQLSGFRWLLKGYPICTFIIAATTIFFSEVVTTIIVILYINHKVSSSGNLATDSPSALKSANRSFQTAKPPLTRAYAMESRRPEPPDSGDGSTTLFEDRPASPSLVKNEQTVVLKHPSQWNRDPSSPVQKHTRFAEETLAKNYAESTHEEPYALTDLDILLLYDD